ncbi:hypothetical protein A3D88_01710 [Candidatus Peribacteria bacterium RIFCSPHIGHO2_02_FULL_52_16]|nr:MAG: hypothetical protein A2706_03950 [Candidatus Peribacteria bacterium RIFCSPHIGHO2_01_FULL_51_35]OGJ61036.1 MAG: hypothetical protein A3D88_01710 [Candidatus Peribacteria bacterium RIFCSPHIGHO2_02_FULL_52_16]
MSKILVTGSIAYDILLNYDGSFADTIGGADLNNLSVSFLSPRFARHHGGTGSNIAWNLRLLGTEAMLVGTIGNDGGEYRDLLKKRGVDVSQVQQLQDHVTSTAIIGTDDAERQIAFFHPGADAYGTWPDLKDDCDDVAYAVVGARNPGLMMQGVHFCQEYKIPYLFDPGQLVIGLGADELKSAALKSGGLIANEFEWELLSEKTGCGISDFLVSTPFIIVTLGEKGLAIHTKKGEQVIPACAAEKVVNPTGAGDALRAGLLTGLSKKWNLADCGRLGAAIASFVVEQEGTLLDTLDLDEVGERAKRAYGISLPSL